MFRSVELRMISKEDCYATSKTGLVVSVQVSGSLILLKLKWNWTVNDFVYWLGLDFFEEIWVLFLLSSAFCLFKSNTLMSNFNWLDCILIFNDVYELSYMLRILAPTTYIFFASAIPVISFGEQLERSTGKTDFDIS